MDNFIDFLGNIYLILIVITLILVFALIGYFVNKKRSKGNQFKIDNNQNNMDSL